MHHTTRLRTRAGGLSARARQVSLVGRSGLDIESLERRVLFAVVEWIGGASGNWNNPGNWSGGAVPGIDDDVRIIGGATTPQVTLDSGEHAINTLTAESASLSITGGALTISEGGMFLSSELNLVNGALTTATDTSAQLALTLGSFEMSGGVLTGNLLVGFASELIWTGGTMASPGTTTLGDVASPFSRIQQLQPLTLAREFLGGGRGLAMSGDIVFQNGALDFNAPPYGLALEGCSIIDGGGINRFRVLAGVLTVEGDETFIHVPSDLVALWLGFGGTPSTLHLLGGGSADEVWGSGDLIIGEDGYHFDSVGYVNNFTGGITFGGGMSSIDRARITGNVVLNGLDTQLTFTGNVEITGSLAGDGQFAFQGGLTTITSGAGASQLVVRQGAIASIGDYLLVSVAVEIVDAGSLLQLNSASAQIGALEIGAGTQMRLIGDGSTVLRVNSLSLHGNGVLDLRRESLIIDYEQASPLQDIRSHLTTGYNNGAWNGNGIHSSFATGAGRAVGYAEATDLFSEFPATFAGQQVDETTVLVTCTRYGDANLDRTVNLDDFARLAANFGLGPDALWTQGNSNYDDRINLRDLNLLAGSFGQSLAEEPDQLSIIA